MMSERRRKLFYKMRNRWVIIYNILITMLILGALGFFVYTLVGEEISEGMGKAAVACFVLFIGEGLRQFYNFLQLKKDVKEDEKDKKSVLNKLLVRFVYHWDLGSFKPPFYVLHEDIRAFLESNMIEILDDVGKEQFQMIEEIYKIASLIKIPVRINKDNYKSKSSKKFDVALFEKFIKLCRSIVEDH